MKWTPGPELLLFSTKKKFQCSRGKRENIKIEARIFTIFNIACGWKNPSTKKYQIGAIFCILQI